MRFSRTAAVLAAALLGSTAAQASQQWSACQTITSVLNYLAYSNAVIVSLSPGISGCAPGGLAGAVEFQANVNGVTADNINSFLAQGLVAYTTGHQVMIFYDNANNNCPGMMIASGGTSGQCP